jgi:hypothetical protein
MLRWGVFPYGNSSHKYFFAKKSFDPDSARQPSSLKSYTHSLSTFHILITKYSRSFIWVPTQISTLHEQYSFYIFSDKNRWESVTTFFFAVAQKKSRPLHGQYTILDILFRFTHKISQKVFRLGPNPILNPTQLFLLL